MGTFKRYLITSTSCNPLNDFFSPFLFKILLTCIWDISDKELYNHSPCRTVCH